MDVDKCLAICPIDENIPKFGHYKQMGMIRKKPILQKAE